MSIVKKHNNYIPYQQIFLLILTHKMISKVNKKIYRCFTLNIQLILNFPVEFYMHPEKKNAFATSFSFSPSLFFLGGKRKRVRNNQLSYKTG